MLKELSNTSGLTKKNLYTMAKVISQQSLEHFMNGKHNFSMKQKKKNLDLCLRRWHIFEELLSAEVTLEIPITGS